MSHRAVLSGWRRTPFARLLLVLVACALVVSGCGFDVYKLPLPGGTNVGSNPITVHAKFRDVLDLVPQTTVKVNDVSVGNVTDITLDGYTADVTMQLRNNIKLPDNALATIRQTSLLGEKFVSLEAPTTGASSNPLGNGDVIDLNHTGRNPEVEEVLGALSLLLNGGGIGQLQTITRELNKTLTGREGSTRSAINQIRILTRQLDDHKAEIVNALSAVNRLSVALNKQRGTIDATLEKLPSALTSINQQRHELVRMLQAVAHLSGVGVRVIQASKASTIDSLRQLTPVLGQFAASGQNFVKAFNVFLTYPFVDEVVGRDPQVARNLHMGDYTNLSVTLDVNLTAGLPSLPTTLPTISPPITLPTLTPPTLPTLTPPTLTLPTLTLPTVTLPTDLPTDLPTTISGTPLPTPSTTLLPSLPVAGANRVQPFSKRGPTMRQLTQLYDPALVSLLIPEMVLR